MITIVAVVRFVDDVCLDTGVFQDLVISCQEAFLLV